MPASERLAEVSQTRADWFWPLIYTVALHAILFALLFVSFNLAPQIPAAQPVIQATVYQLKAERPKSTPVPDKITAEAQKTKAAEREAEQLEQQKRQREAEQKQKAEQAAAAAKAEESKKQAEAAKAAEAKRQAEAAKAAEALKQAEEQARQVAEQAKKQAAEAKRLEAEQKQREAEAAKKRAAEQARQKAEAEAAAKAAEDKRRAEEAEAKRKAEEAARQKREAEAKRQREAEAKRQREAEAKKQREAEEAKRRAEEDRKAKALAELLAAEAQRNKAQGESERSQLIASLDELFVRLVSEQWIRPASTRDGISSEIQVSMLPDGTITQVILVRSSGDTPFDNSALAALRSIGRIPEMQQLDRASFDALYRKRNLIFRPEDLER